MAIELSKSIANAWKAAMDRGFDTIVLLCDARIRPAVHNMIERSITRLPVVAYDEIVPAVIVEPVETVSLTETAGLITDPKQPVAV